MYDKAEINAIKIFMAMRKIPEEMVPQVIACLLIKYERYGLAELVEKGWNWRPTEGEVVSYDN